MRDRILRHMRLVPVAAEINLPGQNPRNHRMQARNITRAKTQRRIAPQFLCPPHIRGQNRDVTAMHFQRDLRQVIFPKRRDNSAIDRRKQAVQIVAPIPVMPVQPGKPGTQRLHLCHHRICSAPRGNRHMQTGGLFGGQCGKRLEQEREPLVMAHISQIGQS